MTTVNDIFPSKYLKAADLNNQEHPLRITNWSIEKLGDESKLLLSFSGAKKGLITNKTNADRIAHIYGPDLDGWIGKEIVLYPEMVNFGGKVTEAVRVKGSMRKSSHVTTGLPPMNGPVYNDSHMPKDDYTLSDTEWNSPTLKKTEPVPF